MAAARYWRINSVESYAGAGLSLSDVALYASGVRQDASATLTCTVTPTSGTLWSSPPVTWADPLPPGFALVWDFGASTPSIDRIDITGPAQVTFMHKFTVQYSTDGVTWTALVQTDPSTKFQGAGTPYSFVFADHDTYWSSVSLLLNGDGTDGSKLIVDGTLKQVTVYGNACIKTAQSKFGGSSIYTDGSGSYITVPHSTDLNLTSGDWTIEAFIWVVAYSSGNMVVLDKDGRASVAYAQYQIYVSSTGKLNAFAGNGAGVSPTGTTITSTTTVTLSAWHHAAFVKTGTTIKLFLDGVQEATATAPAMYDGGQPVLVGYSQGQPASCYFNGYIDSVRITKGLARYTTNFTPPSVWAVSDATPLRSRPSSPILIGSSAIGDTQLNVCAGGITRDMEDGGIYRITGTVKEKSSPSNLPMVRKVRLHREMDGRLIRETWSDASGNYAFNSIRGDATYFTTSFDYLKNYRAVIADGLTPELMP